LVARGTRRALARPPFPQRHERLEELLRVARVRAQGVVPENDGTRRDRGDLAHDLVDGSVAGGAGTGAASMPPTRAPCAPPTCWASTARRMAGRRGRPSTRVCPTASSRISTARAVALALRRHDGPRRLSARDLTPRARALGGAELVAAL